MKDKEQRNKPSGGAGKVAAPSPTVQYSRPDPEDNPLKSAADYFDASLRGKTYFTPAEVIKAIMQVNQQWVEMHLRGAKSNEPLPDIGSNIVSAIQNEVQGRVASFEGSTHGKRATALTEWLRGLLRDAESGRLFKQVKAERNSKTPQPMKRYSGSPI